MAGDGYATVNQEGLFAACSQGDTPIPFFKIGVDFGYASIMVPMGAAVFSMITFYLISAAYRSFRIRSLEAALLMIAAVIVMMGQMPIGEWATLKRRRCRLILICARNRNRISAYVLTVFDT